MLCPKIILAVLEEVNFPADLRRFKKRRFYADSITFLCSIYEKTLISGNINLGDNMWKSLIKNPELPPTQKFGTINRVLDCD